MATKTQIAARRALEVIPLVMRTLAFELRRTQYGVAPVHFRLLFILAERSHNLTELAEKQGVSLPTISNSISTLVDRGWVRRVRAAHDRRIVLVALTPAGRSVLGEIMRTVEARVTESLACLSSTECEQLLVGLAILRAALAPDAESSGSAE